MARLRKSKGQAKGKKKPAVEVSFEHLPGGGLEKIAPGEHVCGFYRDKEEEYAIVVSFFHAGLLNNEKCIYILDDSGRRDVVQAFKKRDIDIEKFIKSGQFELLSSEETYHKGGYFDPDRMVELLRQNEEMAVKEGYRGLRVSGEMTWALKKQPGVDRLAEYEAKLNYFFPGSKTSAICLYDEKKFEPKVLLNIIYTHPKIIINGSLYQNHIYLPPDDFLAMMGGEVTKAHVERAKQNIVLMAEREKNRQLLEEKLRTSERRYRLVVETMNDGLSVIDKDDRLIYVNDKYCELLGFSREELLGRSIYDLVDKSCHEKLSEQLAKQRRGERTTYESTYIRKDGQKVFALVSATPIFDDNRNYAGSFAVIADITGLKRAEEALREARSFAESIVETVQEPLVVLDADMRIISANPAFYECFKVGPEETEGKSLYELGNRQWDIPELRALLKKVVKKNVSFKEYVVVHDFPHIGRRIMMLNARQMRATRNGKPMVLLAIEDITERQRIESQLKRSNDIQAAIVSLLSLPLNLPLEEILNRALKIIVSLDWLGLERKGGIFLADEEQNNLRLSTQIGLPEPLQKTCALVPFGRCLCGRAAATKSIIFTDDLDENHETKYDGIKAHGHYCVPILLDEKVAGVINLYIEEGHRQEEAEMDFLRSAANALALIIARKNFEKQQLDLIYRTNEISLGECYLHRSHRAAFNIVSHLMLLGVPGICFTREAPEKLMEYGIPKDKIIVLSAVPLKDYETIDSLQNVGMRIAEFIKNNRQSVVLLDGLEYLMSRFGFEMVYKFLQEKRFQFIESNSVFILPVDLAVFDEREKALLSSELRIIG